MFTFRYKDSETRDAANTAAKAALSKTLQIEYKDPNTMVLKNSPGIMKTMSKIHSDMGIDTTNANFRTCLTKMSVPNDMISNKTPLNFTYGGYYQIPTDNAPAIAPRIGIISLGGTYYSQDLKLAWRTSGRTDPYKEPNYVIIPGSTNIPNVSSGNTNADTENALDLQLIMTNAPPNAIITIYMAPLSYDGFNIALAQADINNHIVSCSWGISEMNSTPEILTSINKTLRRVVSNGTALVVASGDLGSRPNYPDLTFSVTFPSSSQYSIACGGTSLTFDPTYQIITGETGWSGSGGGYSSLFPLPSYQQYLGGSYRRVPDISMTADPNSSPWIVFYGNTYYFVGGTSAVAPAFSAYLSWFFTNNSTYDGEFGILNNIYAARNTNSFRDITSGTNDPAGLGSYVCGTGYDMVTGLGTPIGRTLAAQLQI